MRSIVVCIKNKGRPQVFLFFLLCVCCLCPVVYGGEVEPLLLSTAPPAEEMARGVKNESEHRAVPVRKYWLNALSVSGGAEACVLHPLGRVTAVSLDGNNEGIFLSFPLPMTDGPMHGVHNTYVIDKRVAGDEQILRVAKRITIHHSCGWGHDYKYDDSRVKPRSLDSIPLEITCDGLWDGNFHSRARSGDTLTATVTHYGKPAKGAKLKIITGKGWTKDLVADEKGKAAFQLIRDYYPSTWSDFKSNFRDRFGVVADYTSDESGELQGSPYRKTRLISTMTWVYSPSRQDYASYRSGLTTGALVLVVVGVGIYIYRERRAKPFQEVRFSEKD